jgi:hypothetical protein
LSCGGRFWARENAGWEDPGVGVLRVFVTWLRSGLVTVRLVRHGVKRLVDAVAAVDEQAARALQDGLEFDYEQPGEKPDCGWRIKRERERMLTRVAQDAERACARSSRPTGCLTMSRSPRSTRCCAIWWARTLM